MELKEGVCTRHTTVDSLKLPWISSQERLSHLMLLVNGIIKQKKKLTEKPVNFLNRSVENSCAMPDHVGEVQLSSEPLH